MPFANTRVHPQVNPFVRAHTPGHCGDKNGTDLVSETHPGGTIRIRGWEEKNFHTDDDYSNEAFGQTNICDNTGDSVYLRIALAQINTFDNTKEGIRST